MRNNEIKTNIGGVIEFDDRFLLKTKETSRVFRKGNFFSNGRSALLHILNKLENEGLQKIYLPLFCCDSIIKTVKKTKLKFDFYSLNRNLEPKIKPTKGSIILVVNYFGKNSTFIKKYEKNKNNKFYLIEDASHSFLNNLSLLNKKKHHVYLSIRKHSYLNVGGWANSKPCKLKYNQPSNQIFINSKKIKIRKQKFLKAYKYINNEKFFLDYFKKTEKKISNIFSNETISNVITDELGSINWKKIGKLRQNNWKFLNKLLENKYNRIFNKISNDEIPLGLILLVKDRDKLRKFLLKKRIFTSIHWPIKQKLSKSTFKFDYYLANHIITIPIDQRYTKKDMFYIAKTILESGIK